MTNPWPTARLGDVAEVQGGLQVTSKRAGLPLEAPYLRVANVHRGRLALNEIKTIRLTPVELERTALRAGDLLVVEGHGNLEEIGRAALWGGQIQGCVHQNHLIRVRCHTDRLFPRFGERYLNSGVGRRALLQAANTTSGLHTISTNDVRSVEVPLPGLAEQRRMAAILDKADELRCKRRMSLALLDSLADAHFLEMFGADSEDMRRPLIEAFAESPNYGSMIPPGATGTHLSLRVANIQNGRLTLADRKYIDLPSKETARHSVRDGDLLLARAIASIDHLGKCVIAAPGNEAWAFDSHLMRLRLNPEIMIPDFLKRWLSSPPGRAAFLRVARRSAVQFNVNTKEMAGLLVPMPPIGTQLTVLEVGAAVERQRERATYLLARLDALFASLEHRAFRGEL